MNEIIICIAAPVVAAVLSVFLGWYLKSRDEKRLKAERAHDSATKIVHILDQYGNKHRRIAVLRAAPETNTPDDATHLYSLGRRSVGGSYVSDPELLDFPVDIDYTSIDIELIHRILELKKNIKEAKEIIENTPKEKRDNDARYDQERSILITNINSKVTEITDELEKKYITKNHKRNN